MRCATRSTRNSNSMNTDPTTKASPLLGIRDLRVSFRIERNKRAPLFEAVKAKKESA